MKGFTDREEKRTGHGVAASIISAGIPTATKGRPKAGRETKKRISLAIMPSLYDDVQKIAFVKRKSVSEIFSFCVEQYVMKNSGALKEYEKIKEEE